MLFKDINCGYYTIKKPGLYVGTYDEVRKNAIQNGIVERAIFNCDGGALGIKASNEMTMSLCRGCGDIPVLHLLPPVYAGESYCKTELLDIVGTQKVFFKARPKTDACVFDPWMYDWMFDVLSEASIPLLLPLQDVELNEAARVKELYPELVIILTNTTQWLNRQYVQFLRRYQNVYLDTSNIIEYYGLENITSLIGAEKILFGTFMPDKEPYDKIFQLLYSELTQEEKELIAFRNYDRLMGNIK